MSSGAVKTEAAPTIEVRRADFLSQVPPPFCRTALASFSKATRTISNALTCYRGSRYSHFCCRHVLLSNPTQMLLSAVEVSDERVVLTPWRCRREKASSCRAKVCHRVWVNGVLVRRCV